MRLDRSARGSASFRLSGWRCPGVVGPLEWGVGNRANQRHRRGEGNAVRAAHALDTRSCRDANGGLPGADRYVVPKGGQSACHNALGQLRCAMWPAPSRDSPSRARLSSEDATRPIRSRRIRPASKMDRQADTNLLVSRLATGAHGESDGGSAGKVVKAAPSNPRRPRVNLGAQPTHIERSAARSA